MAVRVSGACQSPKKKVGWFPVLKGSSSPLLPSEDLLIPFSGCSGFRFSPPHSSRVTILKLSLRVSSSHKATSQVEAQPLCRVCRAPGQPAKLTVDTSPVFQPKKDNLLCSGIFLYIFTPACLWGCSFPGQITSQEDAHSYFTTIQKLPSP